jgi:hypothetical protein
VARQPAGAIVAGVGAAAVAFAEELPDGLSDTD